MQKLLPWRYQTLTPPSILFTYRSIYKQSHSSFDDLYDPPFTKTLESDNRKTSSPKTLDSEKDPKLPLRSGLPFDFRYSYSESDPSIEPIGFREPPRFSPFGPGRLDRKWNGVSAPVTGDSDPGRVLAERESVLGDPLMEEEVEEIVERYRHSDCARQINIGKGGVTHNMLDDIHNHWKRAEAVRIKCLGVATLDMENVCFHLEFLCRTKLVERSSIGKSISFSCTVAVTMILRKDQLSL